MGCVSTITATRFPRQSSLIYKRVDVCFHYDTSKIIQGTIIRDDMQEPYEGLIRLDDGRTVRMVECQWSTDELSQIPEGQVHE